MQAQLTVTCLFNLNITRTIGILVINVINSVTPESEQNSLWSSMHECIALEVKKTIKANLSKDKTWLV